MSRRRKANIRPDLEGELFTDGVGVYRLLRCELEPKAVMIELSNPEVEITKPISFFAVFVRLKPVRPIEKPKKSRADKGGVHRKPIPPTTDHAVAEVRLALKESRAKLTEESQEIADKKGDNLTIHVPTGLSGDTEYKVIIAGSEATGPEPLGLRVVVLAALEEWSGRIPDELTEQERTTIQGILDAGE